MDVNCECECSQAFFKLNGREVVDTGMVRSRARAVRRLVATSTVTVPSPPGPNPVQQPSRFAAASHDEVSVVVGLARVGVGVPLLDGRTRYSLGAQQGCKYANCEIRTFFTYFNFPSKIHVLRIPGG